MTWLSYCDSQVTCLVDISLVPLEQLDVARAKIFLRNRAGFLFVQRNDVLVQQAIVGGDLLQVLTLTRATLSLTHLVRHFLQSSHAHFGMLDQPVSYTHLRAHETRHDLVCR